MATSRGSFPIYKNFDQQALDSQYNNRAAVTNFHSYLEQWKQRSALATERVSSHLDIRYGHEERQTLDLFFPDEVPEEGMPMLVFFHGGYWQAMDKSVFRFLAQPFTERGVMFVLPNYPLTPAVTMDELVESCRDALRWLMQNANSYGGRTDQVHMSGHSAGGHLTAMMVAEKGEVVDQLKLRSGTSLSGLFDLEPIRLTYLNEKIGLDREMSRRNSPIFLSPAIDIPFMAAVGAQESEEYHAQSRDLAKEWQKEGTSAIFTSLADTNHFTILDRFIDPSHPLFQWVMEQIRSGNGQ